LNPRVLVVDDESFIADGLRVYLEDEGMEAKSVASAEQALDLIGAGGRFDVCIMDMRLPGMNGDAAIRALHAVDPDMSFVIHTGSTNYVIPDDLRDLGIGDIHLFKKPLLDMAPLAAMVQSLSGRHAHT
jgi:DNA-binding NtrC family response regulator